MIIEGHYCTGSRFRGYFKKYHPLLCSLCRSIQPVVEIEEEQADAYNNKLKEMWADKPIVREITYEI